MRCHRPVTEHGVACYLGRGTSIESFVRESTASNRRRLEIAIHPYKHKGGAFSATRDSESIVVDGLGRIVDLFTSGSVAVLYRPDLRDAAFLDQGVNQEGLSLLLPLPDQRVGRDIDTTTSGTLVRHLVPFLLVSPYLTSSLLVALLYLLVSCRWLQCRRGGLSFRFVSFFPSHLFVYLYLDVQALA